MTSSGERSARSAALFEKYCSLERVIDGRTYRIGTRRVIVDSGVAKAAAACLQGLLPETGPVLLVCDTHTWVAAGEAVAASFSSALPEMVVDRLDVLEEKGKHAVCDDENIAYLTAAIRAGGYAFVVAVGAGTINDVAKMASFRAGVDYAIVGTAPSMNGYTSGIAAILSNGVKTTQPCHVPVACLCDIDVMAGAPYRMIASGLGDLLSKPVSNADWRLGARLAGAFYTTFPMEMIDAAHACLDGVPAGLPSRDRDAVRGLCESICLSGMAMAAVGTSSPASGGEHLISHYLDMVAIASRREHDFHGCQVGVGTIVTSALYESLLAIDPESIDIERCVARHVPWSAYRRTIEQRFGPYGLTDAVVAHAEKGYPDRNELRLRLHQLYDEWDETLADVSRTLEGSRAIAALLDAADAPKTFTDIGVDAASARRTVLYCKDIRARYTVLHLASELGLLETWCDEVLAPGRGIIAATTV